VIRVLIVDDQALMRAGFRALLDAEDDIEVVGEAADGRAGVELAVRYVPDVVLLDIQMPVLDGIEATRLITADPLLCSVRVVVLTNYGVDEYVFGALRAGATGFLLKDADPDELIRAIHVASVGEALLSPAVTRRLIGEFVARPETDTAALDMLTTREREVLALVARGLANAEIAQHMTISPYTVRTHVANTMTKLAARDRAQLVVAAYESGLVGVRDGP